MRSALIGYTGFVGSNLDRQYKFTHKYNSKNIGEIEGEEFDLIVCAGVNAIKWRANQDPKTDWDGIEKLLFHVNKAAAKRFMLISTVDVYPQTEGVDEDSPIDPTGNHPYGRHRYLVEEFVRRTFPIRHIIRLPGLFGSGLKKNVIYDLINDNCPEMVNRNSSFQYYPLDRLWQDLNTVRRQDIELINFATEPIGTSEIIDTLFIGKNSPIGGNASKEAHYDILTKHAASFGRDGRYILNREDVMESLSNFVRNHPKTT